MTHILLDDDLAKSLEAIAQSKGMTLTTFLATVARAETAAASTPFTGDEIAAMIEAEAGPVRSNYQGTFSREDIYVDHD